MTGQPALFGLSARRSSILAKGSALVSVERVAITASFSLFVVYMPVMHTVCSRDQTTDPVIVQQ